MTLNFRAGQARNGGINASAGAWLIFIDGDMVVHPRFVEGHLAAARPNRVLFGGRVKLNRRFSGGLTPEAVRDRGIEALYEEAFASCREAEYAPVNEHWTDTVSGKLLQQIGGSHRPRLGRAWSASCSLLPRKAQWRLAFKSGANFSTSRALIERTNGFDETFGTGGGEDGELFWRLFNAGAAARPVLLSAVAYHLWHRDAWQRAGELRDAALQIERRTRTSGKIRCERGIADHGYGELR